MLKRTEVIVLTVLCFTLLLAGCLAGCNEDRPALKENEVLPLPVERYKHPMQVEYYVRDNGDWSVFESADIDEVNFILEEFSRGKPNTYNKNMKIGDIEVSKMLYDMDFPSEYNKALMVAVRQLESGSVLLELKGNEILFQQENRFLLPWSIDTVTTVEFSQDLKDFLLERFSKTEHFH